MNQMFFYIRESVWFYPFVGIGSLVIYQSFQILKIKRKMEEIAKLTDKKANPTLTIEDVSKIVSDRTKGIMEIIEKNQNEDGLTREALNDVINKVNETVIISSGGVLAENETEDVPEATAENPEPVAEAPAENPEPVAEAPAENPEPVAEAPAENPEPVAEAPAE
jgi:cytoskeletal protein RodZ